MMDKAKIKQLKKLQNQVQWYVTRDRGAMFNPIFEGGFENKLEAQIFADERCGDRVIQLRNKNLAEYIERNCDLRGENRKMDGAWRELI
jgi:hypothetical protein